MLFLKLLLLACVSRASCIDDAAERTVKKDSPPANPAEAKVVVISEKPQAIMAEQKQMSNATAPLPNIDTMHDMEESTFNEKIEFDSYATTGFYFFLALSSAAIVLIMLRVYRLRLTRAERKYGVQGDRTTQELTPLPLALEDINSDEEDHTLFEINREQIRIL